MASRIEALKDVFEKKNFDGYVVANGINILYLTGFLGATALLIPCNGENVLYVYGTNYEEAKAEAKNCRVERLKRDEELSKKIAEHIKTLKIRRIGFDALDSVTYLKAAKALRGTAKLKAKAELVSELRKVKDEGELNLMRKAAEMTNEGMRVAYETIKPGVREYEVAAEIEYAMRKRGSWGTAFDTIVASGIRSAYPHGGCKDRKIREGDLVVVDIGAAYQHYRADMTRTFVAGKPTEKQEKIFKVVREAQEKAFQIIRSGVKAKDADAAAREVIKKAGYGEFFVHSLGHGIGLEVHESPTLSQESKDRLKAGNVVTVEPGIYIVGFGGFRIEDTVLVRRNGAERFTEGFYSLETA